MTPSPTTLYIIVLVSLEVLLAANGETTGTTAESSLGFTDGASLQTKGNDRTSPSETSAVGGDISDTSKVYSTSSNIDNFISTEGSTFTLISTTTIPALDTVDIIIICITCVAAAGCITLASTVAILNRRKKQSAAKISPDFQEHGDTEAIISRKPSTSDINVEENVTSVSEHLQYQNDNVS